MRNRLVHHVMMETKEDMYAGVISQELIRKIKAVAADGRKLQHTIEMDMTEFCEGKGKDMKEVRARIKMANEGLL